MGDGTGGGGYVCSVCWKTVRGSAGRCGRCRAPLHPLRNPFLVKELRDKAGRVRGRRAVAEVALVVAVTVLCVWGAWLLGIALVPGPLPLGWGDWALITGVDGIALGILVAGAISWSKRPVPAPRRWWDGFEPESLSPRAALEYLGTAAPSRLVPDVERPRA